MNLWPIELFIGVNENHKLNDELAKLMYDVYKKHSLGKEHYERIPHNIFNMKDSCVSELRNLLVNTAKQFYDIDENYTIEGHEIVSYNNQFIRHHVDSEEGDITFQYYVKAPIENETKDINEFGNAAFVLVNPSRPTGSFLFKNEQLSEYPILPRKGLFAMFRSYVPHYQMPYIGEEPMIQIVVNIKVARELH